MARRRYIAALRAADRHDYGPLRAFPRLIRTHAVGFRKPNRNAAPVVLLQDRSLRNACCDAVELEGSVGRVVGVIVDRMSPAERLRG
jgi:hypothetical protein